MKRTLLLVLALLGACSLADEPGTGSDDLSVTLTSSAASGNAPLTVTLNASVENAVGTPEYFWTIADQTFEGESSRSYTFQQAGTYTASVTVTDDDSEVSDSVSITVSASGGDDGGDGSGGDDGGDDGGNGGGDGGDDNGDDGGGSAACQNPVSIPDEVLGGAVRNALSKETGDLTCADMASLEELSYTGGVDDDPGTYPAITDLSGLEYATSLNASIWVITALRTLRRYRT